MPMQVDAENEPVRSNRKIWFPFVTFAIFLVNCKLPTIDTTKYFSNYVYNTIGSIYFYGIFYIIKWRNAEVSLFSPISPPITSWYFYTVTDWPSCQDTRYQYRRMFTLQFIHCKLIGSNFINTLLLLTFL